MSETKNTPEQENQAGEDKQPQRPKLKRNGLGEDFKKKGEEIDKENKPPMSKDETMKFYEENLPFMRAQEEFENLRYSFEERRIKHLELQVRELEALGYLSQWKAGQDEANRRKEAEDKMKAEWEAMTPEEKEEWKKKAQANMRVMEMQAKGNVIYDGTNAHDIFSFVTGELCAEIVFDEDNTEKKFCFQIPAGEGKFTEVCMLPGNKLTRTEAGEFIVSLD